MVAVADVGVVLPSGRSSTGPEAEGLREEPGGGDRLRVADPEREPGDVDHLVRARGRDGAPSAEPLRHDPAPGGAAAILAPGRDRVEHPHARAARRRRERHLGRRRRRPRCPSRAAPGGSQAVMRRPHEHVARRRRRGPRRSARRRQARSAPPPPGGPSLQKLIGPRTHQRSISSVKAWNAVAGSVATSTSDDTVAASVDRLGHRGLLST